MVWEGHGGHGELENALFLYNVMEPEGTANDKDQSALPLYRPFLHLSRQLRTGQRLSLYAQRNKGSPFGRLVQNELRLLTEGLLDLGLGWPVRQPGLRQLRQRQLTKSGEPLLILLRL